MEFTFISHSHEQTIALGRAFGALLRPGCVVGLTGDLGAGKTCFMKGIAYAINKVPESDVTSPTFTILQEYEGPVPLYHFDAYRLSDAGDLDAVGFEDYISGEGIAVIEWADRIATALPDDHILMTITVRSEHERIFTCTAGGRRSVALAEQFYHNLCAGSTP